MPLNWKRF